MLGVATAKLRELKHVRTRGTDSKLESDERKLRDGMQCFNRECKSAGSFGLPDVTLVQDGRQNESGWHVRDPVCAS